MKKLVLIAAVFLAGCVHASVNMLDERTMIVSGRGNAYVSQADVSRTILVRAATEAQARGFPYFVIIDSQDQGSTGSYTTPTTTTGSAYGTASCFGNYCTGQATGTATTYGGQTYQFYYPGMDALVRFLTHEEGERIPSAWNAASVLAVNQRQRN